MRAGIQGIMALGAVTLCTASAQAQWVTIPGPPRNPDDKTSYGSVYYTYEILDHEVTIAEFRKAYTNDNNIGNDDYDRVLNSRDGLNDKAPATKVSWYEAAKYANYLTSGNASNGVYRFENAPLSGDNDESASFSGVDREGALRKYGVYYAVPTEDEWYKAAYYNLAEQKYYEYAHGSNTQPPQATAGEKPATGWNYDNPTKDGAWLTTSGTKEQNGTYNMMGNVAEPCRDMFGNIVLRGGNFKQDAERFRSDYRSIVDPAKEHTLFGFRIVRVRSGR